MDCLFIDIASIKEEAKAFFCFVLRVQFLKIRSAIVFVLYIIAIYTLLYCHKTCAARFWYFFSAQSVFLLNCRKTYNTTLHTRTCSAVFFNKNLQLHFFKISKKVGGGGGLKLPLPLPLRGP